MRRRSFLKSGALAAAAVTPPAPAAATGNSSPDAARTGTVLITSAETALARALAEDLARDRTVRLTSIEEVHAGPPAVRCGLEPDAATDELLRGVGAIVHVAEPPAASDAATRIDHRARRTYNLLRAAVRQGVRRLVYLSSLKMLLRHGDEWAVSEDWRPDPVDESTGMSHYLGEFVCREFAREAGIEVVVLRLGELLPDDAPNPEHDPAWIRRRDAVRAIRLALDAGRGRVTAWPRWSVFHVTSLETPRFPLTKARRLLGYRPGGEEGRR